MAEQNNDEGEHTAESDPQKKFQMEVARNIAALSQDHELSADAMLWLQRAAAKGYSYNFSWLGRPIIQVPQDIQAMQEIIWRVKPDLIIETGVAHGGSLIFSASMLAMLDYCDALEGGSMLDPSSPGRHVLGIDIDIRAHNRTAIEAHPLANRVELLEGSSIDPRVLTRVREKAQAARSVLVCLDSNHTHDHVLAELQAYAPLVSPGSYCVVFDTAIEDVDEALFANRPWGKGNNPKTAVRTFLRDRTEFEVDTSIDAKLLISVAPEGYLKRVK